MDRSDQSCSKAFLAQTARNISQNLSFSLEAAQVVAPSYRSPRGDGFLLSKNDLPEYTVLNEDSFGKYVIVCDHASNAVPEKLNQLGLSPEELSRHIGVDIGTKDIGHYMSEHLNAPAIIAGYSRLVLDLNRGDAHPQQVATVSDGTVIPANQGIGIDDIRARQHALFYTYHGKLSGMINTHKARIGAKPVIVFVHSCTPEMNGKKRPWEIGILWNKNRHLAKLLMSELSQEEPDFTIGDNRPYSLRKPLPGNSVERHAEANRLPHVVVEFRQDLVDTPEKAANMAAMFTRCLERAVQRYEDLKLEKSFSLYSTKKSAKHPDHRIPKPSYQRFAATSNVLW